MTEDYQQFTHGDYTVGWICALPETELVAAAAMLDEEHPVLPAADRQDTNSYVLGRIRDHNVVIACLPAETTGKVSAATVAKDLVRSFPAVRFGLMVGIGGGAPYYGTQGDNDTECSESEEEDSEDEDLEEIRDIRLGDVVISLHSKSTEAVVQYDFGKSLQGPKEFVRTGGKLNKPPNAVLSAVAILQQQHRRKGSQIPKLLEEVLANNPGMVELFRYPGKEKDRLFKSGVIHKQGKRSCKACRGSNDINLVRRSDRPTSNPRTHYGTIGSADQVVKDAVLRDKWAQKEKIICFEMEAAGLMDSFPCLVIRGICDYADSHKNKIWQSYAAATAGSYAKELLLVIPGQGIASLPPIKQRQFRDKVLSWLSPLDYNAKQKDIFARRTPGTGAWLLDTSSPFATWVETPGQTLYCSGIPGAGKTVLASIVIEHLRQMLCDDNVGIAYIYCAYNERHKADDLIACLLKQLAFQIPSLPEEVRKLYDLYQKQKLVPQKMDLISALLSIISSFSRVFIVIDAIDELQDDIRADFLDCINKIKPRVNMFVTSRPNASDLIKNLLQCDQQQDIRARNEDIEAHVRREIKKPTFILSREVSANPDLYLSIEKEVVGNADGMFLHAQFHMEYLALKHNIRDLREALQNLPRTSKEIYDNALERVHSQNSGTVKLAEKTILCVVGAVRPLRVQEIQHALAVREGDQDIDDDALTAPNYLLTICAGLLTIDEESNIIRLVHYTAQEYLKDIKYNHFADTQTEITSICLRYLSLEEFGKGYCSTNEQYKNRMKKYVLLEYVAEAMEKHTSGEISDTVSQLAVKLLSNRSKLSSATQVTFVPWPSSWLSDNFPRYFYGIHYASYMGLAEVVNKLLPSHEGEVGLPDSFGLTPLSWAARRGHEAVAVVKLLLDTGKVDVDLKDQDDRTPLLWATLNGNHAVVTLLKTA
ncbi:hypothetical protein BJX76DRAFT_369374 [Aspergillus varians]